MSPCKDCKDRTLGCHGKCEKYKNYVAERKRDLQDRTAYTKANDDFWGMSEKMRRKNWK